MMKTIKKVFRIILAVMLIWIILYGLLFLFVQCTEQTDSKTIKKYHDVQIFYDKTYLDQNQLGKSVYHTGINASVFLPEFSEIEHKYSDIDFYLFDGTASFNYTAVTLVLELRFDNADYYEEAKQMELSSHSFMTEYPDKNWIDVAPEFEFSVGSYNCLTVQSDHYPSRFGILCFNNNDSILRYLYFEEWESPEYVKDKDYILKCTNCAW